MNPLAHRLLNNSALTPRWDLPPDFHHLYSGKSGTGKTGAMMIAGRQALRNMSRGFHCIDPESELASHLMEYAANPANGCTNRVIHRIKPRSSTEVCGIDLLNVSSRNDLQACNNAAVRARTVIEQAVGFDKDGLGPRTSKLLYLGAFALALKGLPLIALTELYTSAAHLRSMIGEAFPYQFMTEEWRGLDILAEKNPRQFIDYRDALMSRLLPLFASPINRRTFGQAPGRSLDFDRILSNRDVVLLDLGGLEPADAVLIGTAYFSCLYATALQRPIDNDAPADVMIDEVADYLTPDLARGFDRLRKRKIYLRVAVQRFSQFINPEDPTAATLHAVLTNCRAMITFALSADDAELMARVLFTGNMDLDTIWKPGSVRPVAVGSDLVKLRSEAHAHHHAEQTARSVSDSHSASRVRALADASSTAWASMEASGFGLSSSALPDAGVLSPPTVMSKSRSNNNSQGRSLSGARSQSEMLAEQAGHAHSESTSEGVADGVSHAVGSHDAYVTRYADLATEAYSLEEKLHAVTGLIQNLPARSCLVKIDSHAPVLQRTPDLTPSFRSAAFKAQALPLFYAKLVRTSPYLRSVAEVDAEIEQSIKNLTEPSVVEPNFSAPEPARTFRLVKGDN